MTVLFDSYWACNYECDYDYDASVNQDLIGHSHVVPCVHQNSGQDAT